MDRSSSRVQLSLTLGAALALAVAGSAGAVTINPSFETGDTTGWITSGDDAVMGSWRGIAPTDGSFQLLLTTRSGDGALPTASNESDLGLAGGTIQNIFDTYLGGISSGSGPLEGSAVQQSFFADAGDILVFDWNFVTREDPSETVSTDFLWHYLAMPDGSSASGVLAHAAQPASDFSNAGSPSFLQTGYATFRFRVNQTGTYTLSLGVHDVDAANFDSFGIFDGFRLRKGPEPDTGLLVAFGLLGLAWQGRRSPRARR